MIPIKCPDLPRLGRESLLGSDRRMRLEVIGDGLMGIIGDVQHDFDGSLSTIGMLRFYVDDHHLITLRHEPLSAVDNLRRAVATGALRPERPIDLLIQLLNELSRTLGVVLSELTEGIDEIEDNLLAHKILAEAGELARIRRDLAQLRRHLVPQRQALAGIVNLMPAWFTPGHATGVRQAVERLAATGSDLEQLQERAVLLQTELSGRLAEMTNHNLYILSILTAIFLPLTLISGIFGMNVGGLPWVGTPWGFIWVMVLSAGTLIITLALLYWRRLF
jgi:zinc transporter